MMHKSNIESYTINISWSNGGVNKFLFFEFDSEDFTLFKFDCFSSKIILLQNFSNNLTPKPSTSKISDKFLNGPFFSLYIVKFFILPLGKLNLSTLENIVEYNTRKYFQNLPFQLFKI